jgi:hypothetical protein
MPRRARGVSKIYGVGRGKRKLVGHSSFSARRHAALIRAHGTAGKTGGRADFSGLARWKPKRGRRKLGARRKITLIETLFRWIKVPTGKRRRTSRGR